MKKTFFLCKFLAVKNILDFLKSAGEIFLSGLKGLKLFQTRFGSFFGSFFRSRPGKPNQKKGQSEKLMNFDHFCEFWCFSLGKQARFTLNFCSGMRLRKVHELTFLWFGLPGPLLIFRIDLKFFGGNFVLQTCRPNKWL